MGDDGRDGRDGQREPALQVIVLGSGGGPMENNVTALLVRSTKAGWTRGSVVAVDAGVHLSAITRILEETQPKALGEDVALPHKLHTGPFAGLEVKSNSAAVNAANFTRQLIDTYLITHPHLDHISGFVINTAGPAGLRPKRLAGLPSTISAFKSHIFNNVIWPNLSDENNGAGLVTYMRLVEGGSPALGEGEGRGYLEVSDGLAVKAFGVSHGHCIERHTHRGSTCSSRFGSGDVNMMSPVPLPMPLPMPRGVSASTGTPGPTSVFRSASLTPRMSAMSVMSNAQDRESMCVYDSSAYFIRDSDSGREVLIFGDVEADSISLTPRNMHIWQEAAPRIASGNLTGVFIECSYDDSQTDDRLFGHLCPRFIIEELQALAHEVEAVRQAPVKLETTKKRKRETEEEVRRANKSVARSGGDEAPVSPKSNKPSRGSLGDIEYSLEDQEDMDTPTPTPTPTADLNLKGLGSGANASLSPAPSPRRHPLRGLKVVIIHVKDNFSDTETTRDIIQDELLEHEREAQLGCEFLVSQRGDSFML